jgi:hypothetical protein
MSDYVYRGPGPVQDPESTEVVRPGDVREFTEDPCWGPWEALDEPAPKAEAPPSPAPASPLAVTPPELAAQGIRARSPKEK